MANQRAARRLGALTVTMLILCVTVAGCDDSGDGASGQRTVEAPPTATIAPTEDALRAELQAVRESFEASTFRASYTLALQGGPGDPEDITGTMVIVKDGRTRFRIDFSSIEGDQPIAFSIIMDGEATFTCLAGDTGLGALLGAGAEGACIPSDEGDPALPATDLVEELENVGLGNVNVTGRELRTIGGVEGTCYTVADGDAGATSITCFAADGVLLSRFGEGLSFEARSVGGEVTDADFAPPYEVQDLAE